MKQKVSIRRRDGIKQRYTVGNTPKPIKPKMPTKKGTDKITNFGASPNEDKPEYNTYPASDMKDTAWVNYLKSKGAKFSEIETIDGEDYVEVTFPNIKTMIETQTGYLKKIRNFSSFANQGSSEKREASTPKFKKWKGNDPNIPDFDKDDENYLESTKSTFQGRSLPTSKLRDEALLKRARRRN